MNPAEREREREKLTFLIFIIKIFCCNMLEMCAYSVVDSFFVEGINISLKLVICTQAFHIICLTLELLLLEIQKIWQRSDKKYENTSKSGSNLLLLLFVVVFSSDNQIITKKKIPFLFNRAKTRLFSKITDYLY